MWGVYHKTKPKDSVYAIAIKGNGAYKVLVTHPNCAGAKINDCAYGEPKQKKELMNVRLVSDETLIPGWYAVAIRSMYTGLLHDLSSLVMLYGVLLVPITGGTAS